MVKSPKISQTKYNVGLTKIFRRTTVVAYASVRKKFALKDYTGTMLPEAFVYRRGAFSDYALFVTSGNLKSMKLVIQMVILF